MKIYFAQIMDNLAYYMLEKDICSILESLGHEVYFPWRDEGVIIEDESTEQDQLKTFNNDVDHIKWCDVMIAYIDGNDPGTAVETGIAYAMNKPVALYATEFSKLKKGSRIDKIYPVSVLPANSHQCWITEKQPAINNMLLGVSNNTILNSISDIINWVQSIEQSIK